MICGASLFFFSWLLLIKHVPLYFQAFDDKRTLSNILLQLAVMALAESNWGQATSLLLEAQVLCYSHELSGSNSRDGVWYSLKMTSTLPSICLWRNLLLLRVNLTK